MQLIVVSPPDCLPASCLPVLQGDIFFVPQRPYVVLGTLRDQLLYPTWAKPAEPPAGAVGEAAAGNGSSSSSSSSMSSSSNGSSAGAEPVSSGNGAAPGSSSGSKRRRRPLPSDDELAQALRTVQVCGGHDRQPASKHMMQVSQPAASRLRTTYVLACPLISPAPAPVLVQLGPLLERVGGNLDAVADWASTLSLGEQQRLAFARVVLAKVGHGGAVRSSATASCCN